MVDLGLDHIGIAVTSLDEAVAFWEALGLRVEGTDEVPEQGVRVAFLPAGEARVELLEPTGPDSPIAKHLERRGPGMHHLCLQVADIKAAMAGLVEQGYRLLSEEPQPGAHGTGVCFVHPKSSGGVLLELSQLGPASPPADSARIVPFLTEIEVGELVILHCANPKEKVWGVLCRLDQIGITIRGLDLNSIEDWFVQLKSEDEALIGPSTQLVPMHRVERIYLDESTPGIDSYRERFSSALGKDVKELLMQEIGGS